MIPDAAVWLWLAVAWVVVIAASLRRWRERERHDAAKTEEVMESLTSDTTNAHIWDGA